MGKSILTTKFKQSHDWDVYLDISKCGNDVCIDGWLSIEDLEELVRFMKEECTHG